MLYKISQLTKIYGSRTILDIPSMEVEKGRIYALLGPNGAGKTTLLNILGFLEPPTTGDIFFHSTQVSFSESCLKNLRKKVVMIDQRSILFTNSVFKNLEFGLIIRGLPKKKRRIIIDETLEMVGMRTFSQAQAHKLSGGETQRVALARALAVSPEVLLCDEPTSNVDAENQIAIINILRHINEQKNITILFTTHDRRQAVSLSHQILFLEQGKFISSFQENIFNAVITKKGDNFSKCVIQDIIHIKIPFYRDGIVRLFIDPGKIDLVKIEKDNRNGNYLKGRVKQIAEEKEKIRIVIDTGIFITILMSRQRYLEKQPLIGEAVGVILPQESIRIL